MKGDELIQQLREALGKLTKEDRWALYLLLCVAVGILAELVEEDGHERIANL